MEKLSSHYPKQVIKATWNQVTCAFWHDALRTHHFYDTCAKTGYPNVIIMKYQTASNTGHATKQPVLYKNIKFINHKEGKELSQMKGN